jgi:hypothetical protein
MLDHRDIGRRIVAAIGQAGASELLEDSPPLTP